MSNTKKMILTIAAFVIAVFISALLLGVVMSEGGSEKIVILSFVLPLYGLCWVLKKLWKDPDEENVAGYIEDGEDDDVLND